jgi:putative FmdB family regulatory protein
MPIYEYKCTDCEHELEKLQKINDALLTDCPECGKSALKKMISAAGFRLKGSGWYETDFKNNGKKKAPDSDAGKADSSNSTSSKTDGAKKDGAKSSSTGSSSSKKAAAS